MPFPYHFSYHFTCYCSKLSLDTETQRNHVSLPAGPLRGRGGMDLLLHHDLTAIIDIYSALCWLAAEAAAIEVKPQTFLIGSISPIGLI